MIPNYRTTNNELLSQVLDGDEAAEHRQINIRHLADLLSLNILTYIRWTSGMNTDEKKIAYNTALKIYELIYENGDFDYRVERISEIYFCLSVISAEQQNKDETLEHLANAVKYDIMQDTQQDSSKHTSLLLNCLPVDWIMRKNYMSNQSYQTLKKIEHERYDFCRDDERFIKLIKDLQKIAVSE